STKTSKEASLSKGSNITGDGDLNISAGNDIKVVGGKVEVKGEVNFDAGNNVTFEAGKNEIKEDVNAIGAGVFAIGEGGLGGAIYPVDGVSFKETWDALGMPGTVITTTNAKGQNFVSGTGAVILDAIVVLQAGVKIENYQTSKFATTWTESDISGKNININARNGVDIGGGNFGAAGTLNVNSKYLKSTKYEDIIKEEKTGFNVYIKELFGAESSLVDAASKIAHSVEAGGDLNPAVGVAQGVGIASNLILTNLFGAGVQTMIGYEVEQSNGISTKENITNITAKNVNFTTEKDMSLNGVDISATDDVTLNAGGDIKITSAKEQSFKDAYSSQADLRFNQGAGVNMIYGAGVGGHLGLNARVDVNQDRVNNKTNSGIAAGGNLVVKTKGSLDIDGGYLSAEKDVNLEVGKDLNIKSDITTSSKNTYYATASARVGFDLTTNTIVKGDLAVAAGGGRTYNDQQKIDESGITSGGNFIAKVGGDVDLDAAKLGSETGKGSLEVGGDINLKSETIRTDAAGADIVVGVGQLGEMGVSGYISDTIKKQEKVNSAIGVDSVIVKGDVAIDGEKKDITDIPNDINNNREVQEDYFSKGGAFSGVAPVKKGYNAATSYKRGSYDVNP
ncbi:hemagglutinin repeat-containing protein, partial [Fusobacterium necrogenes]|uniref:hemagglutinin repeat-containing protein n=1 Tax=Fusobacterium necrogenes TaxID=858 RepID=UPI00255D1604